jgi:hypothetical protein
MSKTVERSAIKPKELPRSFHAASRSSECSRRRRRWPCQIHSTSIIQIAIPKTCPKSRRYRVTVFPRRYATRFGRLLNLTISDASCRSTLIPCSSVPVDRRTESPQITRHRFMASARMAECRWPTCGSERRFNDDLNSLRTGIGVKYWRRDQYVILGL